MDLLVFAHKAEAQAFINSDKLKPHAELKGYWESANYAVLLTGEDPFYTEKKLSLVLDSFPSKFTQVINLGVCGALDSSLNLNEIYPVNTSFHEKNQESFSLNPSAHLNCITTLEAVDKDNKAQLVDRELWGLAKAAKQRNILIRSYKLISDFNDKNTECTDIRSSAPIYSQKLYEYYCAL